jgi:hypothetical protein
MSSHATGSSEILFSLNTTSLQFDASAAALTQGGWIVTWRASAENDDQMYKVLIDADGNAYSTITTPLTNDLTDHSYSCAVTGLADGGWLDAYSTKDAESNSTDVFLDRWDNENELVKTTLVTNYATDAGDTLSINALAGGGWLVTWEAYDAESQNYHVFQLQYDADGNAGDQIDVYSYSEAGKSNPSVAALSDGGWVVTWNTYGDGGKILDVYQQRYGADGGASTDPTTVDTTTMEWHDDPNVTALADGGWVITWYAPDANQGGIFEQRYDGAGNAIGGRALVNTFQIGVQNAPSVTALSDGGWVVTWQSNGQDGDNWGIYQQRYGADGNPVGDETLVNLSTSGAQISPSVVAVDDGGWVVTWESLSQDGTTSNIYERHFAADIIGTKDADTLTGTNWGEYIAGKGGADSLDGRGGDDVMVGGAGNDTYFVDSVGDTVTEEKNGGSDTVFVSLAGRFDIDNVETMKLGFTLLGSLSVALNDFKKFTLSNGDDDLSLTVNKLNNTPINIATGGGADTVHIDVAEGVNPFQYIVTNGHPKGVTDHFNFSDFTAKDTIDLTSLGIKKIVTGGIHVKHDEGLYLMAPGSSIEAPGNWIYHDIPHWIVVELGNHHAPYGLEFLGHLSKDNFDI